MDRKSASFNNGLFPRHYRAATAKAGFTSISGHPERCMFRLRAADNATAVVAPMPRNTDGQPAVSCAEGGYAFIAASTRSGSNGECLTRAPVSAATALLRAGPTNGVAICPTPVG
jgi:hypothetical protein